MGDRVTSGDVKVGQAEMEEEIGKKFCDSISKMFKMLSEEMLIPVATRLTDTITSEVREIVAERKG